MVRWLDERLRLWLLPKISHNHNLKFMSAALEQNHEAKRGAAVQIRLRKE